jgi:hypothetical protein
MEVTIFAYEINGHFLNGRKLIRAFQKNLHSFLIKPTLHNELQPVSK